jgi:hypothetical protein
MKMKITILALLCVSAIAAAVWAQQTTSLIVKGRPGEAKVIQIEGRNYVDLEGIARLTNGSIRFNGTQVVLRLPDSGGVSSPAAIPPPAFSQAFLAAAIEAMSQVREWRIGLRTAIDRSYPLNEDWIGPFRRQADQSLRQAGIAVSTDSDNSAFQLLTTEFNNMNKMSQKYLRLADSLTYIAPDSLENDPLNQRILNCAHSLAATVSSNQLVDDGSCH